MTRGYVRSPWYVESLASSGRSIAITTRDDVEQLTGADVDDLGRPQLMTKRAGAGEQRLVQADRREVITDLERLLPNNADHEQGPDEGADRAVLRALVAGDRVAALRARRSSTRRSASDNATTNGEQRDTGGLRYNRRPPKPAASLATIKLHRCTSSR